MTDTYRRHDLARLCLGTVTLVLLQPFWVRPWAAGGFHPQNRQICDKNTQRRELRLKNATATSLSAVSRHAHTKTTPTLPTAPRMPSCAPQPPTVLPAAPLVAHFSTPRKTPQTRHQTAKFIGADWPVPLSSRQPSGLALPSHDTRHTTHKRENKHTHTPVNLHTAPQPSHLMRFVSGSCRIVPHVAQNGALDAVTD